MIDEEITDLAATIDALIRQKQPFAIYRIPGEKQARLLTQTAGSIRLIYDLHELNGQRGFVIAPFRVSEESPIILMQPDEKRVLVSYDEKITADEDTRITTFADDTVSTSCSDEYTACFHSFIKALRKKEYDKLVLSRSLTIRKPEAFSPEWTFRRACQRYVHSYVYLCYTPHTGVWLGSTPEIILSGEKDEWSTVALAGTQPLQAGTLPQIWDDKNRKEQEYVAAYIRTQMLSLGIHPVENGPYPAYAGALAHLKTDFRFALSNNEKLGDVLKLLHPTPAVCGLPKETAYQFIIEKEGYDRRYYSGFIGCLDPNGRTDLYVNLRCMHVGDEQLTLYAGGGLLLSSELNDEWLETEKKLQTMQRIIAPALTN